MSFLRLVLETLGEMWQVTLGTQRRVEALDIFKWSARHIDDPMSLCFQSPGVGVHIETGALRDSLRYDRYSAWRCAYCGSWHPFGVYRCESCGAPMSAWEQPRYVILPAG